MQYSLFYDSLRYIFQIGLCGAVNKAEEEDDIGYHFINFWTCVFVEQPLALPGSDKDI